MKTQPTNRDQRIAADSARKWVVASALLYLPAISFADVIDFDDLIDNVPFYSFDSNDADAATDAIFSTTHAEGFSNTDSQGQLFGLHGPTLHVASSVAPDLRVDLLRGAVGSISFDFAPAHPDYGQVTFNAYSANGSLINSTTTEVFGTPGFFDPGGFNPDGSPCDISDPDCIPDLMIPATPPEGHVSLGLSGQVATYATFDFATANDTNLVDNFTYTPSSTEVISSFMGALPDDPIFGDVVIGTDGNPSFEFDFSVTEGGLGDSFPIFIDPDVAIGYDYVSTSGNPFTSVVIPDPLANGDMDFVLVLPGFGLVPLVVGDSINLLDINPAGFTEFSIIDIDTAEALDPTDIMAFITGLTFLNAGSTSVTQTPIIATVGASVVPAPTGIALLGLGLLALRIRARLERDA